jgi:predicted RNase H-like HicB family nuclease
MDQPKYRIEIFWSDEDGGYIANVPDLPYCSAFGESYEEALREVLVAMELYLDTLHEFGREVPEPGASQQPEVIGMGPGRVSPFRAFIGGTGTSAGEGVEQAGTARRRRMDEANEAFARALRESHEALAEHFAEHNRAILEAFPEGLREQLRAWQEMQQLLGAAELRAWQEAQQLLGAEMMELIMRNRGAPERWEKGS